jgi:hypothetical protein
MRFVNSAERYGIKKGLEKGITKGRREGRREHAVDLAIQLANHKIGKLSTEVERQIKRLSLRKLDQLAIALFNFTSQDDLVTWLQAQHS